MPLRWLQVAGLCPYVAVGPEGGCRVGWVAAAWCSVHLALSVAMQVWMNVEDGSIKRIVGFTQSSTVAIAGRILLNKGSQVTFSGVCLLQLLLSPRLPSLMREVAALQRLKCGLNPAGPQRLGATSLVYLVTSLVLYVYLAGRGLRFVIVAGRSGRWQVSVLALGEWLFTFPCFPAIVLAFTREMRRLQAATRAVLPPRWEHLVTEVRDEDPDVLRSTAWCVSPAAASPDLAAFLRRARVLLLQTEEVHT